MIVRGRSRLIVTDSLRRCIATHIGTARDMHEGLTTLATHDNRRYVKLTRASPLLEPNG
jgi:hypothetical protein